MKNLKGTKGITLVALVITIIILLILAGISISSLTGSGLFKKAETAKEKATIAEESEIIKIAYTEILTDNIVEQKEITSNELNKRINKTKEASIEEVNEIPEGAIVVDNGATKGTICKVTMEYVYYIYLDNNPMKKFYIELYDDYEYNGGKLTETLNFNFEDGMTIEQWNESEYCVKLENWSKSEAYPGGWIIIGWSFKYNNCIYYLQELTVWTDNGSTDENIISEGKVFKAYKRH